MGKLFYSPSFLVILSKVLALASFSRHRSLKNIIIPTPLFLLLYDHAYKWHGCIQQLDSMGKSHSHERGSEDVEDA